jgi:hypothetical protein
MDEVINEHFSNLKAIEPELSITILMAVNPRGAAIKHAGCPANAKIKIVGPEERSNGGPDLRILIDSWKWQDLSDRSQAALLHHELTHIAPQRVRKSGQLKLDPYGRPVVRLKPDDWMITVFKTTVQAYGTDALEHRLITLAYEATRQIVLPFSEESRPEPVPRPRKTKAAKYPLAMKPE